MMTKVKSFFSEVKVELQKCSWPWDPKEKGFRRYKELVDSTIVVTIAMEKTIRFAIREGGKTVGAGRASEILD